MKLSNEQIKAVLALPGQGRYEHFIKQIVDLEEIWGLYKGGWALAGTDEGETVIPFWSHEEYANLCAKEDWEDFNPKLIPLEEFIEDFLPGLEEDGILPGVFYTPGNQGVTPLVNQLLADIKSEISHYK